MEARWHEVVADRCRQSRLCGRRGAEGTLSEPFVDPAPPGSNAPQQPGTDAASDPDDLPWATRESGDRCLEDD
jgi:hypothetical protein